MSSSNNKTYNNKFFFNEEEEQVQQMSFDSILEFVRFDGTTFQLKIWIC